MSEPTPEDVERVECVCIDELPTCPPNCLIGWSQCP